MRELNYFFHSNFYYYHYNDESAANNKEFDDLIIKASKELKIDILQSDYIVDLVKRLNM